MNWFERLILTYNKGLEYNSLQTKNTELRAELSRAKSEIDFLDQELFNNQKNTTALLTRIKTLEKDSPKKIIDFSEAIKKLKQALPKSNYKYSFKGDGKSIDIKFCLTYQYKGNIKKYTELIIKEYDPKTPTEIVEAVSKYFIYKLKPEYVRDQVLFKEKDYWEDAETFLTNRKGDCDGTAIAMHVLIKCLLDLKGLSEHYDRLYLCINDNWLEAHANNLWLHDDGYLYTIESTIGAKDTFNKSWKKTPFANQPFYTKTRGIANLNGSRRGSNALLKNYA